MIATNQRAGYDVDLLPGDRVETTFWEGRLKMATGDVLAVDTDLSERTRTITVRCDDGEVRQMVLDLDGQPDLGGVSSCRLTTRPRRLEAKEGPSPHEPSHPRRCPECGANTKVPRSGWPCKACKEGKR